MAQENPIRKSSLIIRSTLSFSNHGHYEAGLVLTGTEVKSLRNGKTAMSDSFAYIKNGEAFLSHLHISEYTHGNRENHAPMRERKLYCTKRKS